MKNKKFLSLLFMLCLAILLVACGNEDTSTSSAEEKDDKITIGINILNDDPYQKEIQETFKEEAEKLGVDIEIVNANYDPVLQKNQLEEFIQKEVDVILLSPVNKKSAISSVKKAYEKGIPVLTYMGRIDESAEQYVKGYFGTNDYNQGKLSAELLAEAINNKGKVVEITGMPGHEVSDERSRGFQDAIKNYPDIELLETQPSDWLADKGQKAMQNLLVKYKQIDGVVVAGDPPAVGVITAIKDANRLSEIKVVTATMLQTGYDYIVNGEQYGSLLQSAAEQARMALEGAIQLAHGEEIPEEKFLDTPKVTAENINQFERPKN